jgi:hypothetical protein
MKCPFCSCESFYVKDPEDAFETYEFDLRAGEIVFPEEMNPSECPSVSDDTEAYCGRCAWHGSLRELKTKGGQI